MKKILKFSSLGIAVISFILAVFFLLKHQETQVLVNALINDALKFKKI